MAESVSPTRPAKPAGKLPQVPYPPHFTDFSFYNTGVSQVEYDALHGVFASLPIPASRNATRLLSSFCRRHCGIRSDRTPALRAGRRSAGVTDLVLWNVLGNTDLSTKGCA